MFNLMLYDIGFLSQCYSLMFFLFNAICHIVCLFVCLMVLNTTFNNSSVKSWRSVLFVEIRLYILLLLSLLLVTELRINHGWLALVFLTPFVNSFPVISCHIILLMEVN